VCGCSCLLSERQAGTVHIELEEWKRASKTAAIIRARDVLPMFTFLSLCDLLRHTLLHQVMLQTEHVFLVGAGARAFADEMGHPRLPPEDLVTAEARAEYVNHNFTWLGLFVHHIPHTKLQSCLVHHITST
jgi:hypothetical protein